MSNVINQFPLPRTQWTPDSDMSSCTICNKPFHKTLFSSGKHHCRKCGKVICHSCSRYRVQSYRICDLCYYPGAIFNNYIVERLQPEPYRNIIYVTPNGYNNNKQHIGDITDIEGCPNNIVPIEYIEYNYDCCKCRRKQERKRRKKLAKMARKQMKMEGKKSKKAVKCHKKYANIVKQQ
eukprot:866896_1